MATDTTDAVRAARVSGLLEAADLADREAARFVGKERAAGFSAETATGALHRFHCEMIGEMIRAVASQAESLAKEPTP